MIEIKRSALVACSPEQMFALVNDVEAYPKRFTWCEDADVLSQDEHSLTARLDLSFVSLRHSFSTHNTLHRPEQIDMQLVGGPLRSLDGTWTFEPCGDRGCKVSLDLRFDVRQRLLGAALRLGVRGMADRMVNDFCAEAALAYG